MRLERSRLEEKEINANREQSVIFVILQCNGETCYDVGRCYLNLMHANTHRNICDTLVMRQHCRVNKKNQLDAYKYKHPK